VQGSIDRLPFPDGCFDVVVTITVVYSVPDDHRAIAELARVVRPGGALLVMEPAFDALRRAHDKQVHSAHRYRRPELSAMIAATGLRVRRSTYAYAFLTPPAAALALAERVRPHTATTATSDVERDRFDGAFAWMAERERRWLGRHDLPVGTTVAVLATRD
jgi:ubiquinone/menaquinone biosynthesis C-methylase UbiE